MMDKKVIAIFGGSFNPIHLGHIALAKAVVDAHEANEVWLLISPQNPLKQQVSLQPEQVRLCLAQKALQNEKHIKVSDFEFHLSRPSYTWNTLQALEKTFPDNEFKLLIGADNWLAFNRWAHHEEILSRYQLLVYPRPDCSIIPSQLPSNVKLIHSPLYPFSSTDIRQRVKNGQSIEGMVNDCILENIRHIYK